MKKFLTLATILIFSAGTFSSCDLDILPSNILTEEQMREAPTGLEDLVNGIYTHYKSQHFIQQLHRMTDFGSDDVVYGHETEDAAINMAFRYDQRNSGLSNVKNHWTRCYNIIYASNVAIELAETMEETPDNNYLKGEALVMQAMAYHELVRVFSRPYTDDPQGKGVIIRENTKDTEPKTRATVKEVYEKIIALLDEAAPLLEDRSASSRWDSSDRSLVSIGAVYALYSRVYLYMGEWDKCIEYSTKILTDLKKVYKLTTADNYKNYFINCTSEKETIWNIAYLDNESGPGLASMITLPEGGCWAEEGYTSTLLADMGKGTSLEDDDARWDFVGPGHLKNGLILTECTKWSYQGGKIKLISPPLFRLPEIYFNRAEAYAQKGMKEEALADINTVRKSRMKANADSHLWKNSDITAAGGIVELVLKEKRIEYPFEFQRWFDLGRHNKDVVRQYWGFHTSEYLGVTKSGVPSLSADGIVVKYSDNHFIYPIPNTEITNNSLCEQNPGY